MNDGVITCLNVLRSVFQHLDNQGVRVAHLSNEVLYKNLEPFAQELGEYFGSFTIEERKRFRDLRGIQGQTTRTRRCQLAIRNKIVNYNPQGLDEFIQLEKAQTNIRAKEIIDWIETTMQKIVLAELKQELGSEWWVNGVPKAVRLKVTERQEQDDNSRGGKEYYFDLMDYRKIITDNWEIFDKLFSYAKNGNKEAKTSWLAFVNEKRNIVAHPSSGKTIPFEELEQLVDYKNWLTDKLQENDSSESWIEDEQAVM